MKKLEKFVLWGCIPVIAAAAILYAVFSTPVIQLDDNYYFTGDETSGEIRVSGGDTVVPRGDMRLWGRYPWVYGTVDGAGFVIDLDTKKVQQWDAETLKAAVNPFQVLLKQEKLDLGRCRTWAEFHDGTGARVLRIELKNALDRREAQKKHGIF